MNKKTFLESVCPFKFLDEKVTWGEYIKLQFKALVGVLCFFAYYILACSLADIVEVLN